MAVMEITAALVKQLRDATGERPSVDVARPDLAVVLHVGAERAQLYVDSSGESLFKRGKRDHVGEAPLLTTADPAELAAMTTVARAILNLHETIARD